jgi:hypothetical protein
MAERATLEHVEQLAQQLPPSQQLKLVSHLSEQLSRSGRMGPSATREKAKQEREALAAALLQELDAIAESIEGEFDSAEDLRQIREERASRL